MKYTDYITAMEKFWIQNRFEASSALPHDAAGSTNWEDFDVHNFCNALVEVISYASTGKSRAISFQERIKAFRIEFDLQFDSVEDKSLLAVRMLVNLHGCMLSLKFRESAILMTPRG